ncbi:hypothetical protein FKB34_01745 [Glycocaulis profundi]|nr:hypothetical protein FKB34_01745 [Glycocaulis profundi]
MSDEIRRSGGADGRYTALALICVALIASLPQERAQRFRRILDLIRSRTPEKNEPFVDVILRVADAANETPEGARPEF